MSDTSLPPFISVFLVFRTEPSCTRLLFEHGRTRMVHFLSSPSTCVFFSFHVRVFFYCRFERVISVLVMINTAVLAAYDPMQGEDSFRNATLKKFEAGFAIVFTIEASMHHISWFGSQHLTLTLYVFVQALWKILALSFWNSKRTGYISKWYIDAHSMNPLYLHPSELRFVPHSPWNQLDFMCVVAGLTMFIPSADRADLLQQVF